MEIKVLDHGYVRLIESWGKGDAGESEAAIIEAARQSTQGSFRGWEKDKKLLKFLYEHKHCYDEQTEVLTSSGFKNWKDVTSEDELAQWDENLNSLVYEKPFEIIEDDYSGKMYRVVHGGVDLLVTPNHKMYVKIKNEGFRKQKWSSQWSLLPASELDNRSMVRYRKHSGYDIGKEVDLYNKFPINSSRECLLKLIGFFIGDGHAGGTYRNAISFHLKKDRKIQYLKNLCDGLGWVLEKGVSDNYVIKSDNITNIFRSQFYNNNGDKILPNYLLKLNKIDSQSILDGLKNSDGSIKRGTWSYATTSQLLAEQIQILTVHAGYCIGVNKTRVSDNINQKDSCRLMFLSRMKEPVINQGKINTSWVDYSGKIYCAYTRTGILVIRRNNKIVLSGNSTPFEFAGMTIEVQAPLFIFREWHRLV